MEFVLFYRGDLFANGKPEHKQELRRVFHRQLRVLWEQEPLNEQRDQLLTTFPPEGILKKCVGNPFTYAPLVCETLRLVARLHITLLRPEEPWRSPKQGRRHRQPTEDTIRRSVSPASCESASAGRCS